MIISASRRTDLPAFHAEWFGSRLKNQAVRIQNPRNSSQIRMVDLSPENVDCFVFWTKNPQKFMKYLPELEKYHYYFQYTLNPYGIEIEKNLPDLKEKIKTFQELSGVLNNRARVVWRYDPILMCDSLQINTGYHIKWFKELADELCMATDTCVISFLDLYEKNRKRLQQKKIRPPKPEEIEEIMAAVSEIFRPYDIVIQSCCETVDLEKYGIKKGACVDIERIEKIAGRRMNIKKHKGQRSACGCVESVDIGSYDTCLHGCAYCYACS